MKTKLIYCDSCKAKTEHQLIATRQVPSYYGMPVHFCITSVSRVYKCPNCGSTITYVNFEDTKIDKEEQDDQQRTDS